MRRTAIGQPALIGFIISLRIGQLSSLHPAEIAKDVLVPFQIIAEDPFQVNVVKAGRKIICMERECIS